MKVELLSYTVDADQLCGAIARTCYSEDDAGELIAKGQDHAKTLKRVVESGHHSVIEHAVFTFSISGISRVASHQLVRHRLASYTQKSARYVQHHATDSVMPDSIKQDKEHRYDVHDLWMMVDNVAQNMREDGIPEEDIRYIYPNALTTNIVVTMNARSLWNFFNLRCCNRAQTEIRILANAMLNLVKEVAPVIFADAGKPCIRQDCPEGMLSCKLDDIYYNTFRIMEGYRYAFERWAKAQDVIIAHREEADSEPSVFEFIMRGTDVDMLDIDSLDIIDVYYEDEEIKITEIWDANKEDIWTVLDSYKEKEK